jgi:deoxyribonuclease (pyrimidine dimer)
MTRINCDLDPEELTDQHLMAEYRELPMVYAALRRSIISKKARFGDRYLQEIKKSIPPSFTLNTGHVTFFYDKLFFLHKRYQILIAALKKRGYSLDESRFYSLAEFPAELKHDWSSTERDLSIIRQRLSEKIAMKPTWYRYYKKPLHD